jgi:hypothetical protein
MIEAVNRGLGFGLTGIADFSTAMPFLDVFKSSRPFLGHLNGQWGGIDHDELQARGLLDANGWPTEVPQGADSIGTVILTELPAGMTQAAGRYRVTWSGDGALEIGLGARDVTYGRNEAWFSYVPDGQNLVSVNIRATDPSNPIRTIEVVHERHIAAFDAAAVFTPAWLEIIQNAHALRFMDWMDTNNSTISTPQDAPDVADASWSNSGGVPLEIMIRLANETQTDPWFTLPHRATDAYMRDFVAEVRADLDPGLTPYFEFSNEVWNWQFNQAQEAHAEGQARFDGVPDAWVQNYAADAVRMAHIIDDIYGANSTDAVRVIATQTGWQGLEDAILNAPNWVAEDPGTRAAPATYFDAYAITGYFDGGLGHDAKAQTVLGWIADSRSQAEADAAALGLSGQARAEFVAAHRYDHATTLAAQEIADGSVTGNPAGSIAELTGLFAYHKAQADAAGLELVMYEGGSHIVGIGQWQGNATLTDFFTHLNYTPEMGAIYDTLMQHWLAAGGTLFNAFTAVGRPSQFGSWGHLRHLEDENPRIDAVEDFLASFPSHATPRQQLLPGSDTSDVLTGTAGADLILGLGGDDRLIGSAGEDHLHGGTGWDIAQLSGTQDNHTLTLGTAGVMIANRSGSGADQLTQIEELVFEDGSFSLTQVSGAAGLTAAQLGTLIELYIAYFNRAPDAIGLNFWGTAFANGMVLTDIAAAFIDQPETRGLYPDGTGTADFITAVYDNVLGRSFDHDGFAFWQNALDSGAVARPQFILAVLEGAKAAPATGASSEFLAQQAADRAYLADKTEIGALYAVHRGLSDVALADAVMAVFDGSEAGFDNAIARAEDVYRDALQPGAAFLMPLLGVLDLPEWL